MLWGTNAGRPARLRLEIERKSIAIEGYCAAIGLLQTRQHTNQSRFTGSIETYDRSLLSGVTLERNIFHHVGAQRYSDSAGPMLAHKYKSSWP